MAGNVGRTAFNMGSVSLGGVARTTALGAAKDILQHEHSPDAPALAGAVHAPTAPASFPASANNVAAASSGAGAIPVAKPLRPAGS